MCATLSPHGAYIILYHSSRIVIRLKHNMQLRQLFYANVMQIVFELPSIRSDGMYKIAYQCIEVSAIV